MSKYDDIINLKRPESRHMPMSIANRAAQFAPFSALTGYDEAIRETSRVTSEKHELSESEGKGYIYKFKVPDGKIPLVVEVPTIITNRNDNCHNPRA